MTVPNSATPLRLAFSRLLLVLLKQLSFFIAGFCSMLRKFPQLLEVPCVSVVTPLANRKVIAAKGFFPVVARHATKGTACRMMIKRFGSRDLSSLGHSRSDLMTFVTRDFLMLGVTETYLEGRSKLWRPRIASEFMTRATRRDLSAVRLRAGRVTSITSCVCVEASGN